LDLQLPIKSVPITINVVSSNPAHGGGVHVTTLCDKVCQRLEAGPWFSPGTPVSSTNKTDRQDITEILLKVALNTIKQTKTKENKKHGKTFLLVMYIHIVDIFIEYHK